MAIFPFPNIPYKIVGMGRKSQNLVKRFSVAHTVSPKNKNQPILLLLLFLQSFRRGRWIKTEEDTPHMEAGRVGEVAGR